MMMPPDIFMVLGSCPECKELVIVFCGQVLPLDKEVMMNGTHEDRRDHVMRVMTEFLEGRLGEFLEQSASSEGEPVTDGFGPPEEHAGGGPQAVDEPAMTLGPIRQDEFDHFIETDLNRLDNGDYFRSVFCEK